VQGHAADQLHVEVAHAQGAAPRLAGHGKRLGQQAVEGLAVGQALRGTRRSSPPALVIESACSPSSSALICRTTLRMRLSSRSLRVPNTFFSAS
jgi:hypothetical protein